MNIMSLHSTYLQHILLHSIEMQCWVSFYFWNSCESYIIQLRAHTFDAMTTTHDYNDSLHLMRWRLRDFLKWEWERKLLIESFSNILHCAKHLLIASNEITRFFKVWTIARLEQRFLNEVDRMNRIEVMRQQHLNTKSLRDFESKSLQSVVIFDFSSSCVLKLMRSWSDQYNKQLNIIDSSSINRLQMIDQFAQSYDISSTHRSIEASTVCIMMLMSWNETDDLAWLYAFCICNWSDRNESEKSSFCIDSSDSRNDSEIQLFSMWLFDLNDSNSFHDITYTRSHSALSQNNKWEWRDRINQIKR